MRPDDQRRANTSTDVINGKRCPPDVVTDNQTEDSRAKHRQARQSSVLPSVAGNERHRTHCKRAHKKGGLQAF